ncbi:MAG: hypothetical protein A2Z91_07180 [Deltaproteobacteria bacterium GWA2_38_16]|nr:MAG: hypothetical protein A2Z91_07180 [Deltaproteobacteria bacterium GWA2_38_16]OGQ02692.1 MAG: hypothetical protein A3D19_00515 [Deltaproteobacteria bacterium RIFCSPHIGHO2_02_FULL_38_15]OGQ32564.1 MAG: hypothetical protein A3A72_02870 [Deltaproteobacteria bacterium RIFCSPLOWO2_01_FULL_38_9]OGQ59036.1 MAG: hypothetical protein A3G92_05045 [Deltaproteobacteria bacterium RIFCSPLOWO2_12_FULL_38_8]HBQ20549.1 hypothetical protein [Deltaproteobacteria bacterium]
MAEFKAKLDKSWLSKIADFIEETAKSLGCDNKFIIYDLKLAVDEAATNIMTHGKESQKQNYFTIKLLKNNNQFEVEIIDTGTPFPFNTLSAKGFGVKFIKAVTDGSSYETLNHKNILRLTKHLNPKEDTPWKSKSEK